MFTDDATKDDHGFACSGVHRVVFYCSEREIEKESEKSCSARTPGQMLSAGTVRIPNALSWRSAQTA